MGMYELQGHIKGDEYIHFMYCDEVNLVKKYKKFVFSAEVWSSVVPSNVG